MTPRALVLVLLVAAVGAATPAGAAEPVRVAVGEGLRSVDVAAADLVNVRDSAARRSLFAIPGGRVIRVTPGGSGLDLVWGSAPRDRRRVAMPAIRLSARRGPLASGPREYGGALAIWRSGDTLLLVNEVPLEEYVAGTVRAEAPERWPIESLRALAVVARTYAVFHQEKNGDKPYHLVASSQHQNYVGRVVEGPAWEAARGTAGQVLTWRGSVFPTFYHSDSGGFTEPPQLVFSGERIPPLPGVRDEFSLESPNYSWAVTLPLGVIGERLRQGGLDVGDVRDLAVLERSPSFRVARLQVEHSKGTTPVRGSDFRRLVGYDVLKSTLFVPVVVDGAVRFEGRGWGHGVGLSQCGAKGMADRGYAYAQILGHFYPGTTLATLK
jgi:stage II sporulation protein D